MMYLSLSLRRSINLLIQPLLALNPLTLHSSSAHILMVYSLNISPGSMVSRILSTATLLATTSEQSKVGMTKTQLVVKSWGQFWAILSWSWNSMRCMQNVGSCPSSRTSRNKKRELAKRWKSHVSLSPPSVACWIHGTQPCLWWRLKSIPEKCICHTLFHCH